MGSDNTHLKKLRRRALFAASAPAALGRFNSEPEKLAAVESNGWKARGLKRRQTSSPDTEVDPGEPIHVVEGLDDVEFLRRPVDGLTLQASRFHAFEKKNRKYFVFPYAYRCKSGKAESCYQQVLKLAVEEMGELDYLHPLASVIQLLRGHSLAPFITRCWDFAGRPAALIKTARMRVEGSGDTLEGACICYQPPTRDQLESNPTLYLNFRSTVAHEIGHQWWILSEDDRPDALRDIDDEDEEMLEQVVGLFSVFLILYRGYWHREPHSRDQVELAYDKLGFETDWALERKEKIIDDVLDLGFPSRTFHPDCEARPDGRQAPKRRLTQSQILEIREAAREVALAARAIPFASAAAVLGQRKLDYFVGIELAEPIDFPAWGIEEVRASHIDPEVPDIESQWRHVRFRVPRPHEGEQILDLNKTLEVARQIAHLRLFGDRFGESRPSLTKSTDVERSCSATDRDLARILALALYVQEGDKSHRKLHPDIAKYLLHHDPSRLGYLVDDFDYFFQWCCVDLDNEEAEDRFLAMILEVGDHRVSLELEDEDGDRFTASLPLEDFYAVGITDAELRAGVELKVFGVGGELIPFSDHHGQELAATAGPSQAGLQQDSVLSS